MQWKVLITDYTKQKKQISEPYQKSVESLLKDKAFKLTQSNKTKEKRMKINEKSFQEIWDQVKGLTLRITGAPEREEKPNSFKNLLEEITEENFSSLARDLDI